MSLHRKIGSGWQEEAGEEHNSHSLGHHRLKSVLDQSAGAHADRLGGAEVAGRLPPRAVDLPSTADLRRYCGPTHHQGAFNTCNAHVVSSLLEYFVRKEHSKRFHPSRRFLFTVAKNFNMSRDASGVHIRQVMGVLRMIGVPPEKFWPYPELEKDEKGEYPRMEGKWLDVFDEEPSPFCYALAAEYQATRYYRLDSRDEDGKLIASPEDLLKYVKKHLAGDIPVTLGFPMYAELIDASEDATPGMIPYPTEDDTRIGGHAVVAVGYDDDKVMTSLDGSTTTGALRVQNSWGSEWGEDGFGWIAYEYVLRDRTRDFWTLISSEFTQTGIFQLGLIEDDEVDTDR